VAINLVMAVQAVLPPQQVLLPVLRRMVLEVGAVDRMLSAALVLRVSLFFVGWPNVCFYL
jgi:hypothetical protein